MQTCKQNPHKADAQRCKAVNVSGIAGVCTLRVRHSGTWVRTQDAGHSRTKVNNTHGPTGLAFQSAASGE